MDDASPQMLTALFTTRSRAEACLEALKNQGFAKPWMAVTTPAHGEDFVDAFSTTAPSRNAIAETSDGVLASLARFFNGEGHSLRHVLEGRGLASGDAERIDRDLAADGAVVLVDPDTRPELVEQIVRRTGGSIAACTRGTAAAKPATGTSG